MEKRIKISAVSYLNTKPLIWGLSNHPIMEQIDLSLDIPSVCASKLKNKEVDLAFAPVAVIPSLETPNIVSDFCISCTGRVKTVCLFSDVPVEEIKEIYLDYQSRTSVQLLKILLKDYWKINPELLDSKSGYEHKIKDQTAALVIGDRAIDISKNHKYVYDLGECWKALHDLPFVFASWISLDALPTTFINAFNDAMQLGLDNRQKIIKDFSVSYPNFDIKKYLYQYIEYDLSPLKKSALKLFLSSMESPIEDPSLIV